MLFLHYSHLEQKSTSKIAYCHVNTIQLLAILRIFIPTYHIYCLFLNKSTNEYADHILLSILLQLFQPFRNTLISGSSSEIKYNKCTRCAFIICLRYCSISLLTCCVPDLGLDASGL